MILTGLLNSLFSYFFFFDLGLFVCNVAFIFFIIDRNSLVKTGFGGASNRLLECASPFKSVLNGLD